MDLEGVDPNGVIVPPNAWTAYFGRRTRSDRSHPFDLTCP
jgi:hypothetical protein